MRLKKYVFFTVILPLIMSTHAHSQGTEEQGKACVTQIGEAKQTPVTSDILNLILPQSLRQVDKEDNWIESHRDGQNAAELFKDFMQFKGFVLAHNPTAGRTVLNPFYESGPAYTQTYENRGHSPIHVPLNMNNVERDQGPFVEAQLIKSFSPRAVSKNTKNSISHGAVGPVVDEFGFKVHIFPEVQAFEDITRTTNVGVYIENTALGTVQKLDLGQRKTATRTEKSDVADFTIGETESFYYLIGYTLTNTQRAIVWSFDKNNPSNGWFLVNHFAFDFSEPQDYEASASFLPHYWFSGRVEYVKKTKDDDSIVIIYNQNRLQSSQSDRRWYDINLAQAVSFEEINQPTTVDSSEFQALQQRDEALRQNEITKISEQYSLYKSVKSLKDEPGVVVNPVSNGTGLLIPLSIAQPELKIAVWPERSIDGSRNFSTYELDREVRIYTDDLSKYKVIYGEPYGYLFNLPKFSYYYIAEDGDLFVLDLKSLEEINISEIARKLLSQ